MLCVCGSCVCAVLYTCSAVTPIVPSLFLLMLNYASTHQRVLHCLVLCVCFNTASSGGKAVLKWSGLYLLAVYRNASSHIAYMQQALADQRSELETATAAQLATSLVPVFIIAAFGGSKEPALLGVGSAAAAELEDAIKRNDPSSGVNLVVTHSVLLRAVPKDDAPTWVVDVPHQDAAEKSPTIAAALLEMAKADEAARNAILLPTSHKAVVLDAVFPPVVLSR
ncbi:hypothetical protein COO60DRAFT_1628757 [Scenedesmus sp. NREL 46B-D3]|nr:hypothetical protein COO60DRAFT_1628757 [Scenedesmus sp. NREL 46B-D3]